MNKDLHNLTTLQFYTSKKRAFFMVLASLVFIACGFYFMNTRPQMAWYVMVVFSFSLLIGLITLLNKKPLLIINEIGIYARSANRNYIVWEFIKDAYPITITGQKFISLVVDKRFKPSQTRGMMYKSAVKFNEAIGAQEMNIHLGQIKNIDEHRLAEFITTMAKAIPKERLQLIKSTHF